MKKDKIISIVDEYIMLRVLNFYDVNEITGRYAERMEGMLAYITAEETLGKDAPEDDKDRFVEGVIKQKFHEKNVKKNKKLLNQCYKIFKELMEK